MNIIILNLGPRVKKIYIDPILDRNVSDLDPLMYESEFISKFSPNPKINLILLLYPELETSDNEVIEYTISNRMWHCVSHFFFNYYYSHCVSLLLSAYITIKLLAL